MRSVNLQLGLNSFWQEREGGEGWLCSAAASWTPRVGQGRTLAPPWFPRVQRDLVGAVPFWGAGQGMGNLFQLCPEPLTLVQSLPGGSVRPTDP